jgi:catechol-2,3-dioxygenase
MDFHEKDARSYDAHGPAPALPLVRLNHVSFQCESVEASVGFYQRVLGFELVKRPASLDFGGAW